jgi:hypothetical protein
MSRTFEPVNSTHRAVGTARMTVKQAAAGAIMAGLLLASLLIGAVSFAALATAKGQEGGVVCTGTELAGGTCQPRALSATPVGSMPLGCQASSGDTMACGRRGFHVEIAAGAPSAESAANGPTRAFATQPGTRSGVSAAAQPRVSRHAGR